MTFFRQPVRMMIAAAVICTLGAFATRPASAAVTSIIHSDAADGAVYRTASSGGVFSAQVQIIGSAAGPANYNGVTFYQLPDQRVAVSDASLDFLVTQAGPIPANIDLYGLGYIHGSPALVANWEFHDLSDGRTLLNGVAPTKIADNFVAANTTLTVNSHLTTNATQDAALVGYLNSLYAAGAVAGDFVAFRVNPDADVLAVTGTSFQSVRLGVESNATLTVSTIPEPASAAMLAVGSLMLIRRRRSA